MMSNWAQKATTKTSEGGDDASKGEVSSSKGGGDAPWKGDEPSKPEPSKGGELTKEHQSKVGNKGGELTKEHQSKVGNETAEQEPPPPVDHQSTPAPVLSLILSPAFPTIGDEARLDREAREEEEGRIEEAEISFGPFPGGPQDASLLGSYRDHIAFKVWASQEGKRSGPLKMVHHGVKLEHWVLKDECELFRKKVEETGLANLGKYTFLQINRFLLSALVERWYPETNTFHLPFGELTITIDDVKQILGIPIRGKALQGPSTLNLEDATQLVTTALGVTAAQIRDEFKENRGNAVRLEWLRERFSQLPDTSTEEEIDRGVRAYLLFLIGSTLFCDKTCTKVSVAYLRPLLDLTKVKDYAWGVAGLAYLYRQLGIASRCTVKQIAGYLTLFEAWIYEHFPTFRTAIDLSYENGWPRVRRWITKMQTGDLEYELQRIREALDDLSPNYVVWDPYKDVREFHPFDEVAWYAGCILCFDTVEGYNVVRVLRQFGRIQSIPHAPLAPRKAVRGYTSKGYKVEYKMEEMYWNRWEDHVLALLARGSEVVHPSDCSVDYLGWFKNASHPRVQPPRRRSAPAVPAPPLDEKIENWKKHRDAALDLLKESFALGENQRIGDFMKRERKIYEILSFDLDLVEVEDPKDEKTNKRKKKIVSRKCPQTKRKKK